MPLLTNGIYDEYETFTQEFRLSSNSEGPLQWMIGAWYQDETVKHDRSVLYKESIGPFIDLILGSVGTNLNTIAGQVAVQGLAQISNLPPAAQASILGTALPPLTMTQIGGVLAGVLQETLRLMVALRQLFQVLQLNKELAGTGQMEVFNMNILIWIMKPSVFLHK